MLTATSAETSYQFALSKAVYGKSWFGFVSVEGRSWQAVSPYQQSGRGKYCANRRYPWTCQCYRDVVVRVVDTLQV